MTNAWKRIVVALCAALMVIAPPTAGSAAWPSATVLPDVAKDSHLQEVRSRGFGGGGYRPAPTYRAPAPSYSPPVYRAPAPAYSPPAYRAPAPSYRQNVAPTYPSSPAPQRWSAPPARIAPPPPPSPTFARPFAPPARAVGPIASPAARFGLGTVQPAARPQSGFVSRFGASSALTAPAFAVRRNASLSNNVATRIASVGVSGRAASAFNKVASSGVSTKTSASGRRIAAVGATAAAFALATKSPASAGIHKYANAEKDYGRLDSHIKGSSSSITELSKDRNISTKTGLSSTSGISFGHSTESKLRDIKSETRSVSKRKDGEDSAKTIAPAKRESGTTVLGHYPDYVSLSEKIGARRFQIPESAWSKMSPTEQWQANRKFLDRTIKRNDKIVLATNIDNVRKNSYLSSEIDYLKSHGFSVERIDGYDTLVRRSE